MRDLGLPPLGNEDAGAYDFSNAFAFGLAPKLGVPPMVHRRLPRWERIYLRLHPGQADVDDIPELVGDSGDGSARAGVALVAQ